MKPVVIIRYSCLTGKAVWIYQGASHKAAKWAYWMACKKEVQRYRYWAQLVELRKQNIARFLAACTERLPLTQDMTPEQKSAARQLLKIKKRNEVCDHEFYDHIVEEAKRRSEASRRWRKNRNEWLGIKPR